jgi:hypothetical protein
VVSVLITVPIVAGWGRVGFFCVGLTGTKLTSSLWNEFPLCRILFLLQLLHTISVLLDSIWILEIGKLNVLLESTLSDRAGQGELGKVHKRCLTWS